MFIIKCGNCGYEVLKQEKMGKLEGGISLNNPYKKKSIEIKCENCGNKVLLYDDSRSHTMFDM